MLKRKTNSMANVGIQDQYSNWLHNFKWKHFITLTTEHEYKSYTFRRKPEIFFDILQRKNGDTMLFYVLEQNPSRKGYHCHGLLQTNASFNDIRHYWQIATYSHKLGTYARLKITDYNEEISRAKYCLKYMQKGSKTFYDHWDILSSSPEFSNSNKKTMIIN